MKRLEIEARLENLDAVTAFVDEQLESVDCPMKTQMQIDLSLEEIFVNIAHYAYTPEVGMAVIETEVSKGKAKMIFYDRGVPYDPLAKEDPDITLSAQERAIGGLGIFMVKKSMDNVEYEYRDGQNILTLEKNWG
ncbi:ATP-binding protein [Ruminococcus sp.]|uniref:ATP-binding protein n=1 Tax=Ruminococcus sp. TaxID=41978 RepID=UPI0025E43545|nr:ATP-binding protein [Ruminococcus sp.]MBQ8967438.1 ATP-binding protein [Ruminococcus sp.]